MKLCTSCKYFKHREAHLFALANLSDLDFIPERIMCLGFGTGAFGKAGFHIHIESTTDFNEAVEAVLQAETCSRYIDDGELS